MPRADYLFTSESVSCETIQTRCAIVQIVQIEPLVDLGYREAMKAVVVAVVRANTVTEDPDVIVANPRKSTIGKRA
ncbi:MAG: hypothetical protein R3D34_04920 [Nitratireductor sp.]